MSVVASIEIVHKTANLYRLCFQHGKQNQNPYVLFLIWN